MCHDVFSNFTETGDFILELYNNLSGTWPGSGTPLILLRHMVENSNLYRNKRDALNPRIMLQV